LKDKFYLLPRGKIETHFIEVTFETQILPHFLEVKFETHFIEVTFETQILPHFLEVTFETQVIPFP
jgi:putative transposon-encoded protein